MNPTETPSATGAIILIRTADSTEVAVTEHAASRLITAGGYARKTPAPAATVTLTRAARRDLATLRAGGSVDWRVGPLLQLQHAGLVTSTGQLAEVKITGIA